MTKQVKIKAAGLLHMGASVEVGKVLTLPEKSAKSLVDAGAAAYIEEDGVFYDVVDGLHESTFIRPVADEATEEGTGPDAADAEDTTREMLDKRYKRDELHTLAKDLNVEVGYDDKKAEIIEAIITAGVAATLLQN